MQIAVGFKTNKYLGISVNC